MKIKKISFVLLTILLPFITAKIPAALKNITVQCCGIESYSVQEFVADFTKFRIGDTVPNKYRTSEYAIKQWKLRNLPSPRVGKHWIYMNKYYVLIDNNNGKIYRAYNSDIFYHQYK